LSTGSDLLRLQCAFIDTDEVEKVTDFIGMQRGYPDAFHLPEYADEETETSGEIDPNERDELFEDAAHIIVQTQQGSTSLLQRKLKLGYNRAGRIIDQLEAAGIVGPFEGSKAREVKVANEMALEQYLRDLNSKNNEQNN
jgi:S-DNA-T family DNA segregation ATPase FtsK/SpoIIIE